MNRAVRLGVLLLSLALLCLAALPAHAAPTLSQVESQVTILQDGRYQVRYRLTFVDDASRRSINTIGPFDPGHSQIEAILEHEGGESPVQLVPLGDEKYRAELPIETRPGGTYTLQVRYLVERYLDSTVIDGVPYRVVAWAPPQWALPTAEQIVTFILPVELPAGVTQPEQVTQEIVDQSAIFVEQDVVQRFDRWVYYPPPTKPRAGTGFPFMSRKKTWPPTRPWSSPAFTCPDAISAPRPPPSPRPSPRLRR